jgi:hypothetical protein
MLPEEIKIHDHQSAPRKNDGLFMEASHAEATAGRKTYAGKAVEAAAGIGIFAFSVAAFYRIRELFAAFILFSVIFGVVAAAFLILWLAEWGAHEAAGRIETHLAHIPLQRLVGHSRAHVAPIHRTPPWN